MSREVDLLIYRSEKSVPISYENATFSKNQNYNIGPTIKGRWKKFSKNIQVTINKYAKLCISSCLEIMLMNGLY